MIANIQGYRARKVGTDGLAELCHDLFASLARSDQRRWAEAYVRGLIDVPGRKSIRRMCEHVVGWPAEQCLQQFVNQSPWEWQPVRRTLAQTLSLALGARAWVVREVVFPKNGANSVGVARQYAGSQGRTLNCQLGLVVSLAGTEGTVPVNWRLQLPRCWDGDAERRERSHLPDNECHRPAAQHLLEAVDEMIVDWGLLPVPLIVDGRHAEHLPTLLRALDNRGVCYLVQIASRMPVELAVPTAVRPTAGDLVAQAARRGGTTLSWRDADGRLARTQYVQVMLPGPILQRRPRPVRPRGGPRRLLAAWSPGGRRAESIWLTNLANARLPDLVELNQLGEQADRDLLEMADGYGLQHFEGRSYRGWQHHTTLVSVAYGHRVLTQLAERAGEELASWTGEALARGPMV